MDGLECSEISFRDINLGDRYDAEYFTKEYLNITNRLSICSTKKLGDLAKSVTSAFYPAATHLYDIGDTPFVRCVDCITSPIISKEQDGNFEKIPYQFALESKGISFLKTNDIVITKVGSPCYASLVTEYEEVALSRTVLGLTDIHNIDPVYLLVFLRCKYGFEQLYRQRELTIQYQLTLERVKAIDVFLPSQEFQNKVRSVIDTYGTLVNKSKQLYKEAEQILLDELAMTNFSPSTEGIAIKKLSESFERGGRLDAEYYQPKYDYLFAKLNPLICKELGSIVSITKSIEPGSEAYQEDGIPFIRVSDITKYELSAPKIHLDRSKYDITKLKPKKDTILLSKDGSVGIAYKVESDLDVITSGALLHLTVTDISVLPDYLALVLNSLIVNLQAERDAGGSIIQHWKPSEIEKVIIPILPIDKQTIIIQKVQNSFKLRAESKILLETAKIAVEKAVEQGEVMGYSYLDEAERG